jgi:hypothetical protein
MSRLRRFWRRWLHRMILGKMIEDWERRFPGRCLICAHWRYGMREGFTQGPVPPHYCVEHRPE